MAEAFLDAAEIRANSFVRHVEVHGTLGSTNDRAAEFAGDPKIELPALIVARNQTAGRGRGTNVWTSSEGALTFSILIDPLAFEIDSSNWPQLSLTMAVALCDALDDELHSTVLQPRLGIKWPNDVMLDDRKVCGILIESPGGAAPAKDRLIVGIGINVNNSWRVEPNETAPNGIAICDATNKQHNLQAILIRVLQSIHDRIEQLAASYPALPLAWQRLSWLTGRRVEVHSGSTAIGGDCRGIDFDGALLVENDEGIRRLHSGSIRLI